MINEDLKRKAESGDPVAMRELAKAYLKEANEKQEKELFDEALKWMNEASMNGDAEADHEMASFFRDEDLETTREEDLVSSFELEKSASEKGYVPAFFNLAVHYQNGYGTEVDTDKAFYWFRKSAESGETESKERLGACYLFGSGTQKDFEKASYWMEQAANEGHAVAKRKLGVAYVEGYMRLKVDEKKGWALIQEAADLGDQEAIELIKQKK